MILGFTGTRDGMTEDQWHWTKRVFHEYLHPVEINVLHHGCCIGADSQAHSIALGIRNTTSTVIHIVAHPPLDKKYMAHLHYIDHSEEPEPYLTRNKAIVRACHRLIACPNYNPEQKGGTWMTIRHARKLGKPITIIWPNGNVTEEQ